MPLIFKVGNQSKKNWRHPLLFLLVSIAIVSSSDDEEKSKNHPDVDFDSSADVLPPHKILIQGKSSCHPKDLIAQAKR